MLPILFILSPEQGLWHWPLSVSIVTFSVPLWPLTSDQPSSWRLLPGGGAAEREETLGGVWHHLLWLPPPQRPLPISGQQQSVPLPWRCTQQLCCKSKDFLRRALIDCLVCYVVTYCEQAHMSSLCLCSLHQCSLSRLRARVQVHAWTPRSAPGTPTSSASFTTMTSGWPAFRRVKRGGSPSAIKVSIYIIRCFHLVLRCVFIVLCVHFRCRQPKRRH